MTQAVETILTPFTRHEPAHPGCQPSRIDPLLLILFVFVNGIVFLNGWLHPITVNYDASDHIAYVETLASFRLPGPETDEFFSPPLPYIFPALILRSGWLDLSGAIRVALLFNGLLSICLTYGILKLGKLIEPCQTSLRFSSLFLIATLPVFYKTYAFLRGETYLAPLAVWTAYLVLQLFLFNRVSSWRIVGLGILLGLLALARQWGFFIFPAVMLFAAYSWLHTPSHRAKKFWGITAALAISFLVGSWFYFSLYARFGTFTAFNRPSRPFALSNNPASFYTGLGNGKLFKNPIRPSYQNQMLPILYTETWGDYWAYFLVYGQDLRNGNWLDGFTLEKAIDHPQVPSWLRTNRYKIKSYLARVNLVSLIPTAIMLSGFGFAVIQNLLILRRKDTQPALGMQFLFVLVVIFSLAGFFYYLVTLPSPGKGATLKTVYMIQVFPFVAMIGGSFLDWIRSKNRTVYGLIFLLLCIVALHNFPTFITHHPAK